MHNINIPARKIIFHHTVIHYKLIKHASKPNSSPASTSIQNILWRNLKFSSCTKYKLFIYRFVLYFVEIWKSWRFSAVLELPFLLCDSTTAAVRIRIKPKTGSSSTEFDHGTKFYSMREADKLINSPEDRIYWRGLQDTTCFSTSKTLYNYCMKK